MLQNRGSIAYKLISAAGTIVDAGTIEKILETIDISGDNAGIYILQIIKGESIANYQIIKE